MNKLENNFEDSIRLSASRHHLLFTQLQKNSGTKMSHELTPDIRMKYATDAFVPKNDWTPLRKLELDALMLDSNIHENWRLVTLAEIPPEITAEVSGLAMNMIQKGVSPNLEIQEIAGGLIQYIHETFSLSKDFKINGIAWNRKNLPTTTVNLNGDYVGLHVDSWDNLPFAKRKKSSNRISINLGKSSRYLLFINLTLKNMYEILVENDLLTKKIHHFNTVYRTFLLNFPYYPILRLEIKPNQAYIAPTENMIHDGSTLGSIEPSYHLSILGNLGTKLD